MADRDQTKEAALIACRAVVETWDCGDLAGAARLCQSAVDMAEAEDIRLAVRRAYRLGMGGLNHSGCTDCRTCPICKADMYTDLPSTDGRNDGQGGTFYVFRRAFRRVNSAWSGGLEPHKGRRTWLQGGRPFDTEAEARAYCVGYNRTHRGGRLSVKAEYTDKRRRSRRRA
jgi:hypothetical protein